MNDFFKKLKVRQTVLKRTNRNRPDLPKLVIYLESREGEFKRVLLDSEGKQHVVLDAQVMSSYKVVTGPQAEELIATHWAGVATVSP